MKRVYRIGKSKFVSHFFDGEGSFRFGGRWSSGGSRIIYAAESLSLGLLEMLVHLENQRIISSYSYAVFEIDESLIMDVKDLSVLPADWRSSPAPDKLKEIGDAWIRSDESAVLRVPTAILPEGSSFLINVLHPDFKRIKKGGISALTIDKRLAE